VCVVVDIYMCSALGSVLKVVGILCKRVCVCVYV